MTVGVVNRITGSRFFKDFRPYFKDFTDLKSYCKCEMVKFDLRIVANIFIFLISPF